MIEVHIVVLLAVLQIAIVFGGIGLITSIKSRRLQRECQALEKKLAVAATPAPPPPSGPDPSAYLSAEADASRARGQGDMDTDAGGAAKWLALRADMLQLESVLAKQDERDEAFWQSLQERMQEMLASHGLQTSADSEPLAEEVPTTLEEALEPEPAPAIAIEDDELGLKQLLADHLGHIGGIKDYIDRVITDSDNKTEAMKTLDKLARSHKELSQCVEVLEDENSFLRDQIAALLQHQ